MPFQSLFHQHITTETRDGASLSRRPLHPQFGRVRLIRFGPGKSLLAVTVRTFTPMPRIPHVVHDRNDANEIRMRNESGEAGLRNETQHMAWTAAIRYAHPSVHQLGSHGVPPSFRNRRRHVRALGVNGERTSLGNDDEVHVFHRYRPEQDLVTHDQGPTCSGMHRCKAPESANASTSTGSTSGSRGFLSTTVPLTKPIDVPSHHEAS
jgi:hypothetical protein